MPRFDSPTAGAITGATAAAATTRKILIWVDGRLYSMTDAELATLLAADAGANILRSTDIGVTVQGYDADTAAIAALGYTSGAYFIRKTAANTYDLQTVTAAGLALLDDAAASDQRTTLGLGTAAAAGVAGLRVWT